MRIAPALLLLGILAACVPKDPQVVAPASVGIAAAPHAARAAVTVDGSRMTTALQPWFGCAAYNFPIDGREAFESALRNAAAANAGSPVARVEIVGDQLRASMDATGGLLQGAEVTVVIDAALSIEARPNPVATSALQATGHATSRAMGLVGCDSIGPTLADAYRDALRGLASQVADRLRQAR